MKISSDQFKHSLSQGKLLPCYWLTGDELFQLEEAKTLLRQKAKELRFLERQSFETTGFDASYFLAELYATSLFASQKIIELKLTQGKLNEAQNKALQQYLNKPNPNIALFIYSPKLEGSTQNTTAFKLVEKLGAIVQFWPISLDQYPKWLAVRLQQVGLSASLSALKLLAELTEGNLLAAAQYIDQLSLIYPNQQLQEQQIYEVITQDSNYDVFLLNEAFLLGDHSRIIRILRYLKETDEEIILIASLFAKELRLIAKLKNHHTSGQLSAQTFTQLGIWDKKKPLYQRALQRPINVTHLLSACNQLDQIIKGQKAGDAWLMLEDMMLGNL